MWELTSQSKHTQAHTSREISHLGSNIFPTINCHPGVSQEGRLLCLRSIPRTPLRLIFWLIQMDISGLTHFPQISFSHKALNVTRMHYTMAYPFRKKLWYLSVYNLNASRESLIYIPIWRTACSGMQPLSDFTLQGNSTQTTDSAILSSFSWQYPASMEISHPCMKLGLTERNFQALTGSGTVKPTSH